MTSIIIDPSTSKATDMTNAAIYNTAYVDICQADGTIISSAIPALFTVRTAGASQINWTAGPYVNTQAGNWMGFLKILNSAGQIVDQQVFNLQIIESF